MNSSPSETANQSKPTHEQIALRAELLWKAKGTPNGQDEQTWLEAERQLEDEMREILTNSASTPEAPPPPATSKSQASETMSEVPTPKENSAKNSPQRKRGGR